MSREDFLVGRGVKPYFRTRMVLTDLVKRQVFLGSQECDNYFGIKKVS